MHDSRVEEMDFTDARVQQVAHNETSEDWGKSLGCHPGLLRVLLQNKVDEHMSSQMARCIVDEQSTHHRISDINALIAALHTHRKKLEDPDEGIEDDINGPKHTILESQMQRFREEHWPALREAHSTVGIDQSNPFPDSHDPSQFKTPDDVADAIDKLRQVLDHEQYSLTQLTRQLTKLTSDNDMITTMHSRMKSDDVRTMVKNQLGR